MAYYKMRPRGGTSADWKSANPILADQEIAFEYIESLGVGLVFAKMGDGVTPWNDLPYAIDQSLNSAIISDQIVQNNQSYLSTFDTIKNDAITGKNLLGSVVGGNSNTSFQTLAQNALTIKNQRDQYASQIPTLNSQIGNLNTQLSSVTKDRDNWKNIANSKTTKIIANISQTQGATIKMPKVTGNRLVVDYIDSVSIWNGVFVNVLTYELDRLLIYHFSRGNNGYLEKSEFVGNGTFNLKYDLSGTVTIDDSNIQFNITKGSTDLKCVAYY